MKAATVKELKEELSKCSQKELIAICLRLSKFKKENKELLTYLLYESKDETIYIENVKNEIDIYHMLYFYFFESNKFLCCF